VAPLSGDVVALLSEESGMRPVEIRKRLDAAGKDAKSLDQVLEDLERQGVALRVPGGAWELPHRTPFRVGRVEVDRKGRAFLVPAQAEEGDVFLHADALGGAFHGDTALVRITSRARKGRLREGQVVEVLDRGSKLIRGRFWRSKEGGYFVPDDRRYSTDVHIPRAQSAEAKDGDAVLVRLVKGSHGNQPVGEVAVRLDDEGSLASDLAVVRAEFDLPGVYPAEGLAEAEQLSSVTPGAPWPERQDLRGLETFTIDPVDAKDFDDAVSLEALPEGRARLGVHIADVSHYVPCGGRLDSCAEERGTSVYLYGEVIPMLPQRLANDLASLRPGEDRLTKTVFLTFDAHGTCEEIVLCRSVISSRRRFTYEEVQAILDWIETGQDSAALPADHAGFADTLKAMAALRDKLRSHRRKRGALYLDIPRLRVVHEESGRVTGLTRDERDPSHDLIEEFMLEANEAVARYSVEHKLPLVARVHPPPDEGKVEDLRELLAALDVRWHGTGKSKDLQKLLLQVAENPLAAVMHLALLRTMGHAEYALGRGLHFALATKAYCHFTSPIRRYPDLLVHQVLDEHLDGKLRRSSRRHFWEHRLPELAARASELERRAEDAERAMSQLRLVRYLEPLKGSSFHGRVVSVQAYGFYVRLDGILVEGLVHVASLDDDYYELVREKQCLLGQRRKKRFCLGQEVDVVLSDVDPVQREVRFELDRGAQRSPGKR
jgi:ribonuclease R